MKVVAIGADISSNDVSVSDSLVKNIEKDIPKLLELGARKAALTNVTHSVTFYTEKGAVTLNCTFEIIDEEDQLKIVSDAIEQLNLDKKKFTAKHMRKMINFHKCLSLKNQQKKFPLIFIFIL